MKKRRKRCSTPVFIDLTLSDSSEEEEVVDLNVHIKVKVSTQSEFLGDDDNKEPVPISRFPDTSPIRVDHNLYKLQKSLFRTISANELMKYIGKDCGKIQLKMWEKRNTRKRIDEVIKKTKHEVINSKHPLYSCLEGNDKERLKDIYCEHISSVCPENISKDGLICELIRKFFGGETALQMRNNESQILLETGSLEEAFQFQTICGQLIPNEIILQILSFLPRNYEIIVKVGSVCQIFYVLLLCTWDEADLNSSTATSIPLTVLKNVRKLTLRNVTISEVKYIFSITRKLKILRIDGRAFTHSLKNSGFSFLYNVKREDDSEKTVTNILNNLEEVELPNLWWLHYGGHSDLRGRYLKDLFPKIRSAKEIHGKLPVDVFRGSRSLEELGVVGKKDHFLSSKGFDQDLIKSLKKVVITGEKVSDRQLELLIYPLKNLEEVKIVFCEAPAANIFYRRNATQSSSTYRLLPVFDSIQLEENDVRNLKKLSIFSKGNFPRNAVEFGTSIGYNCILHLDEFTLEMEERGRILSFFQNVSFVEIFENSFLTLHHIKRLKLTIPAFRCYKSSREIEEMAIEQFRDFVCGDNSMLKGFEVFDLKVRFAISTTIRIRFDRKLGDNRMTAFRIIIQDKVGAAQVFVKTLFEVLVKGIMGSRWMKNQILDYIEVDMGELPSCRQFLKDMRDLESVKRGGYVFCEVLTKNSCCVIRKSLL